MIRYACPECGELLQVDDAKVGGHYVCSMCAAQTRVPDDIIHQKRLRELAAIHKTRHLTSGELTECARHLRALGNEEQAAKAERSAARQHERERHAAALEVAGAVTPSAPRTRRRPRASVLIVTGAIVAIAVTTFAVSGPYLTLASIGRAARKGDSARLSALIDFPDVRESVKGQVRAAMTQSFLEEQQTNSDPWAQAGAALGMSLGAGLIDTFVDAMLTPESIARMVNELPDSANHPPAPGTTATAPTVSIQRRFDSLSQFSMTITNQDGGSGGAPNSVVFVLTRQGASWRLTDIRLPKSLMKMKPTT